MAIKTLYGELSPGLVAYYIPPTSKSVERERVCTPQGTNGRYFPGVIDLVDWVVWIDYDAVIVNQHQIWNVWGYGPSSQFRGHLGPGNVGPILY